MTIRKAKTKRKSTKLGRTELFMFTARMSLSHRQWEVLTAMTEMFARNAEVGIFNDQLLSPDLLGTMPDVNELRELANIINRQSEALVKARINEIRTSRTPASLSR
jgi:hypothetical protein